MKSLPEFTRQTSRAQAALPRPDTSKTAHTIRRRFIVASPFVAPPRLGRVSVVTEGAFEPIEQCTVSGRRRGGRTGAGGARVAVAPCSRILEVSHRRREGVGIDADGGARDGERAISRRWAVSGPRWGSRPAS